MLWLAADPVIVLPAHRDALEALVRAHSTSQQLALRARMILHAADNIGVRESARELDVWPKTVRYWRTRWREALDGQSVPERLCDAPRSGAPATYTPEQICAVIAMTCERPSESERPISHWSQREIADEAIRRGLVPSISQRSVGRILKKPLRGIEWVILTWFRDPARLILLFDWHHPSAPTCTRDLPARAAAVKDGPPSGHRVSGAQRP